jgi:hypothetical protein
MIDVSAALRNHITYIAGNRKNAGKTTFLNCALEQLRPKGHLAYLSIGVDGEERDLVFGHAKPQILAQPGDTLLTAQAALAKTDALYEIHQVFPYKTVLGRLVVAMITRGGFVELVGPETNRQLETVIHHMRGQERLDTILVDGSANRLTQVATTPGAGYVYVAQVGRRDSEKAISAMKRLYVLDAIPQLEGPCLDHSFEIHGALTERKLAHLPLPETCSTIVLQDFTKVFLSLRQIARLQNRYQLLFRDKLDLRFFVVNLLDLDRDAFLDQIGDDRIGQRIVFNPYEN